MEFLAIPIFIFFVFAVFKFTVNPYLAVISIVLVLVIDAWFIEPPSVYLGLHIYLYDVVFIPLFLSALIRIIIKQEWRHASFLWAVYGLIIFYQLFVGLKQYGTIGGVDFRNFFCYWTGTFYFMTFAYTKEMLDKICKYWLLICSLLLLIVYFRFIADLLHLPMAQTWIAADSNNIRFRVISSGQCYLLAAVVIMLFHRYVMPEAKQPSRILTVAFIVAVIVLQHRSVWAATIAAIATMFLLPGIRLHKIIGKLAIIGVVGMVLMAPLVFYGFADYFIDTVVGSAERATHLEKGTFGSRVKYWEHIMIYWNKLGGVEQLLGEPWGSGYAGNVLPPHNMFFHSLLRAGSFGTFILIIFYLSILIRLFFHLLYNKSDRFYPSLFFMLIVEQLIYYIPYGPQPQHGVILGIAASLIKRKIPSDNRMAEQNSQYFLNMPSRKIHHAAST